MSTRARTGDPTIDRLVDERVGPDVDKRLNRLVQSPSFQRRDDLSKAELLNKELTKLRKNAKARVLKQERPRIVQELVDRLKGQDSTRQRQQLQRLRRSGSINAAIERAVLRELRRA